MKSHKKNVKSAKQSDDLVLLRNQLARVLADYDNLRRRVETERETWVLFSSERILNKIIPVLDALEKAEEHLKDQGLGIAISEFKKVLSEEGLEEIKPNIGDKFDQNDHEAVEAVKISNQEGSKKGHIAELVLVGWKYKSSDTADRIIRHAKVKVFSEVTEKETKPEKEIAREDYA